MAGVLRKSDDRTDEPTDRQKQTICLTNFFRVSEGGGGRGGIKMKALALMDFKMVKCPKLQRGLYHEVFFRIYSKINQVIYLSLPIFSPNIKALAAMSFEIHC